MWIKLSSRPKELKGIKPIMRVVNKNYVFSLLDFYLYDGNLIVFFRSNCFKIIPSQWGMLKNYRHFTAREVLSMYDGGRNFEDAILKIWKQNQLPLGFIIPCTRDIKR